MTEESDNLGNFYLLPLVGLNKNSFSKGNFINSYLGRNKDRLIVKLKERELDEDKYCDNDHYETDFLDEEENTIVVFKIPKKFSSTVDLFRAGKYSRFSKETKELIIKNSGLTYKVKKKNSKGEIVPFTDKLLLALDRSKNLRLKMEEELAVKISPYAELVSIPCDKDYYDI